MISKWLATVFGVPIIQAFAKYLATQLRLAIRKSKNKELKENLKNANTPEERERAAQAIIDQFNNSDK